MSPFARLAASSPTATDVGLLVLRVSFGLTMALSHGWGKVSDLGKFTAVVASKGFPIPGVTAPFAAFSELLGGLLLAVGLATRPAAVALLGTMIGAVVVVHGGDPFGKKELGLAYAAVSVVLLLTGPGRFSLDRLLARRR